ncbi:plasmid partitioning protein RepA [Cereibacter sp. SYSU M97828]|nr:plasmid partitioning protein RepA [Cereibacter flavus]
MNEQLRQAETAGVGVDTVSRFADALARSLDEEMRKAYRPTERKTLRRFSVGEVAEITGISANNLRQRHNDKTLPHVETDSRGHRTYAATDIQAIREVMARTSKTGDLFRPGRRGPEDHLQVLSVVNFKGGSSKTTTSIHLAQRWALRGYRVLAIDLDPQGSLSTFFGLRPELDFEEPDALTIYDAICYDDPVAGVRQRPLRDVIRKTYFPNLDMVPASLLLSEYETETAHALSANAVAREHNVQPPHDIFAVRLAKALGAVEADYDLVVIDCPPQLGFTTLSALAASTGLIVTVVPGMLDVASMSQFLKLASETMRAVQGATHTQDEWDFLKFLVTRYEPADGPQIQMSSYLRHILGGHVLKEAMLKSTAISDAGMTHQTIYEVDPKQLVRSTLERAVTSMNAVSNEIEKVIQAAWGRSANGA